MGKTRNHKEKGPGGPFRSFRLRRNLLDLVQEGRSKKSRMHQIEDMKTEKGKIMRIYQILLSKFLGLEEKRDSYLMGLPQVHPKNKKWIQIK